MGNYTELRSWLEGRIESDRILAAHKTGLDSEGYEHDEEMHARLLALLADRDLLVSRLEEAERLNGARVDEMLPPDEVAALARRVGRTSVPVAGLSAAHPEPAVEKVWRCWFAPEDASGWREDECSPRAPHPYVDCGWIDVSTEPTQEKP